MRGRLVSAVVLVLGIVAGSVLGQAVTRPQTAAAAQQEVPLQAPPLNSVVMQSTIATEAGIAAYFKTTAITLSNPSLRSKFRTIQVDNPSYILGSVLHQSYPADSEDPKVYVSADGWVMAYFLSRDPTAKIIDIANYLNNNVFRGSKLELALASIAAGAGKTYPGATYYDFRYPSANRLMLVGERAADGDPEFNFRLPSSFTYYEQSVTGRTTGCGWSGYEEYVDLDTKKSTSLMILNSGNRYIQLSGESQPDTDLVHTLLMWEDHWGCIPAGAIGYAVTYRVP
jgi:hypothetical protein